jgi:cation diffusion facilitator CzcD-associated flavoprotein CzcO
VRLREGARIAIVGSGPSGITAAKHALEAGFDVTVFEAGDRLGGQWDATASHSGVWPGMHTNTSRAMTAFSDFPAPATHPLHPTAEQVHAYLESYARAFGVVDRIRFATRVEDVRPGWTVDGERFDAVIVASGRFRRPRRPPVVAASVARSSTPSTTPGQHPSATASPSCTATGSAVWRSPPTSRRTPRSSPPSASRGT